MDGAITFLIYAIAISALLLDRPSDVFAAIVFCAGLILHDSFLGGLDGYLYFVSAAFVDLLIIVILGLTLSANVLAFKLQVLSLLSIVTNSIGWLLWLNYSQSYLYAYIFAALYLSAIIIIMQRGRYVGCTIDDWVRVNLCMHRH